MKRLRLLFAAVLFFSLPFLLGVGPFVRTGGEPQVQGPLRVYEPIYNFVDGFDQTVTTETKADLTLYVRTTGNDANDCLTAGTACLTIQEAVDRVPRSIGHAIVIDIGEGDFDGAYLAGFKRVGTSPSFKINGVLGQPTLTTGTPTGTATGGGTRDLIDAGQNWTVDELIGYLALVNSEYRVIYDNDATSFNVVAAYSGNTNGKAYEILEQKTNIDTAETVTNYGGLTFQGNLLQIAVEDIKFTGILIGIFNGYTVSGAEPVRCRFNACTYAGFFCQDAFEELALLHNAALGCQVGYYITQGTQVRGLDGCLAYGSTSHGFHYTLLFGYTSFDQVAAIDNGGEGVFVETTATGGLDIDYAVITGNTKNGIRLEQVHARVDLNGGIIDGNGEYGIVLDNNTTGQRSGQSFLNANGTITISNNTLGGILARNHSIVALTDVDGAGNGNYGLELQTGSYATITTDTGITGATGDATINDGTTTLTWATHFNDNGDIAVNTSNLCVIERKD